MLDKGIPVIGHERETICKSGHVFAAVLVDVFRRGKILERQRQLVSFVPLAAARNNRREPQNHEPISSKLGFV